MRTTTRATIEDLYKVDGKAELANGEIVHMAPPGRRPGRAGGLIYASLLQHERSHGGPGDHADPLPCPRPEVLAFLADLALQPAHGADAVLHLLEAVVDILGR